MQIALVPGLGVGVVLFLAVVPLLVLVVVHAGDHDLLRYLVGVVGLVPLRALHFKLGIPREVQNSCREVAHCFVVFLDKQVEFLLMDRIGHADHCVS